MRPQSTWTLTAGLLVIIGTSGCSKRPDRAVPEPAPVGNRAESRAEEPQPEATRPHRRQKSAIARIEELGGQYSADRKNPDKPVVVSVDLRGTQPSDSDLAFLGDLGHLKELYLSSAPVTSAALEHLAGLTNLRKLYLSGTRIDDAGLELLKGLTSLERLSLSSTEITDAGLEHVQGLNNLQELVLYNTHVTDEGLKHLKSLTKLRKLQLSGTHVTEEGVKELQQALPHCEIRR